MGQCAGIKRDGGRCAVVVGPGQSHCYAHDPHRSHERKRNASRGGRSKGQVELGELKKRIRSLAAEVLDGTADRSRAAVANQLYNTLRRTDDRLRGDPRSDFYAPVLLPLFTGMRGRGILGS